MIDGWPGKDGLLCSVKTCGSLGLSQAPAVLFRGFLVIGVSFYVPDKTFFFAHLLKTSHHLLN